MEIVVLFFVKYNFYIMISYRAGAKDHQLQSLLAEDTLVACRPMVIVKHAVRLYVLIM